MWRAEKKFRKTNCGKLSGEALIARWQWIYLHKAQMAGTYSDVFIAHSFTFLNCKSEDRALSYILKNSDCSNSVTDFIFMLTICMFCTIYSIMLFNRKKISKHAPNSRLKDVYIYSYIEYIYTYRIHIHFSIYSHYMSACIHIPTHTHIKEGFMKLMSSTPSGVCQC